MQLGIKLLKKMMMRCCYPLFMARISRLIFDGIFKPIKFFFFFCSCEGVRELLLANGHSHFFYCTQKVERRRRTLPLTTQKAAAVGEKKGKKENSKKKGPEGDEAKISQVWYVYNCSAGIRDERLAQLPFGALTMSFSSKKKKKF